MTTPIKNVLRRLRRAIQRFGRKVFSPLLGPPAPPGAVTTSLTPLESQLLAWFKAGVRPQPAPTTPGWQVVPFGEGRLLVGHPLVDFLYIGDDDLRNGPRYVLGTYQERQTIAIEHAVSAGDHVLHLGAEYGFHTLTLAERAGESGQVLALEANSARRERCCENIRAHGFERRARVGDCGDEQGELAELLRREAFRPTLVYLTEGAELPESWWQDLQAAWRERPELRVIRGAAELTPADSEKLTNASAADQGGAPRAA